jgi:hypothetical protein
MKTKGKTPAWIHKEVHLEPTELSVGPSTLLEIPANRKAARILFKRIRHVISTKNHREFMKLRAAYDMWFKWKRS